MNNFIKRILVSLALLSIICTTVTMSERPVSFIHRAEASSSEIVGPIYMEIGYSNQTRASRLGRDNAIRQSFSDGTSVLVYHLTELPQNKRIRVEIVKSGQTVLHGDMTHIGKRYADFHIGGKIYQVNVNIFNDSYLFDEPEQEPKPEPEEKPESSKPTENKENKESNDSTSDSSSSSKQETSLPSSKKTGSEETDSASNSKSTDTVEDNIVSADDSESKSLSTDTTNEVEEEEWIEEGNEMDEMLQDEDTILDEEDEVDEEIEEIEGENKSADRPVFRSSVNANPLPLDTPSEQPAEEEVKSQKATDQAAVITETAGELTHSQDIGYVIVAVTLIALSITISLSYKRKLD